MRSWSLCAPKPLGLILDVERRADAVARHAPGAQVGHVGGAGLHHRQRDGVVVLRHHRFDGAEGLGIEARRRGAGPRIARRPVDLDRRIVDDAADRLEKPVEVLVGQRADVELRLHLRRDDVDAIAGLDDRRRDRGPQHRRVDWFVLPEVLVGGAGDLRIGVEHGAIALGLFRRRDAGQALEVGAGGLVDADRRDPARQSSRPPSTGGRRRCSAAAPSRGRPARGR